MRILMKRAGAAAFVAGLAACSSSKAGPPATDSSVSLSFTFETDAGQETHWCRYIRLPKFSTNQRMLTGYSWTADAMHHWSFYRTTPDLPANVDFDHPFDCFAAGAANYLQGAAFTQEHLPQSEVVFGAGMGFALNSEEIIAIEAHTINPTAAPIQPTITVQLQFDDPANIPNKLGLISFYDPFISVPADGTSSAQMRCKVPRDLTLIRRWGHMHIRGTDVQVFQDAPDGTQGTTPIAASTDWEHPPILLDPVDVPQGSYIRTTCDYQGNGTPAFQGPDQLTDEMCMFIAYYYPAVTADEGGIDFERCTNGDTYGTGTTTCAELLNCVQACPPGGFPDIHDTKVDVGTCFQQCVVDSCPSASTPFIGVGACLNQNCQSECASSTSTASACTSCIASNCLSEYAACQSATCSN